MTVKNRAQLNSDADTLLPDNETGAIEPVHVRQAVKDLADSAAIKADGEGKTAGEIAGLIIALQGS